MKRLNIDKRCIPLVSLLFSVIVLAVAWYVSYPYFLRWLEGFSFFTNLPDFVQIHYHLPEDILKYAGAFLLQFYKYPLLGAIIQAVISVLFVSLVWSCIRRIFAEPEHQLWLAFIPLPLFVHYQLSDLTLARSLAWMLCPALLLLVLITIRLKPFFRVPKFLSGTALSAVMSVVFLLSSSALLVKGNDLTRGYEEVARLEYLGENQRWEEILRTVSVQESQVNEYQRRYALLALLNTGKLADHAFAYGLSGADDFLFNDVQEPFCLGFNILFYKSLGMANPAIYQTYQRAVQSAPGISFNTVRFLADCYLETGDYTLARKYLDLLSHSTCHRGWVKSRLPKLQKLAGRSPSYSQTGSKFYLDSFLADISSMYDRYPHDRRFADLLLCGVLAQKDGTAFYRIYEVVSKYLYPDGKGVPDLYQEALLLVASKHPEILARHKIDESVWKRFADFTELMQQGKSAQAKRKYSGTYWAYVY